MHTKKSATTADTSNAASGMTIATKAVVALNGGDGPKGIAPLFLAGKPVKIVYKIQGASTVPANKLPARPVQPTTTTAISNTTNTTSPVSKLTVSIVNNTNGAPYKTIAVRPIRTICNPPPTQTTNLAKAATTPTADYRDLFAALLKIRDPPLVARVMAAINGVTSEAPSQTPTTTTTLCSRCASPLCPAATTAIATQTQPEDFRQLYVASRDTDYVRQPMRKRRRREPHAVKMPDVGEVSTGTDDGAANIACGSNVPFITRVIPPIKVEDDHRHSAPTTPSRCEDDYPGTGTLNTLSVRRDSDLKSIDSFDNFAFNLDSLSPNIFDSFLEIDAKLDRSNARNDAERLKRKMAQEYRTMLCFDPDSGLLPIHVAALNGELKRVMRLVKIFAIFEIPLNNRLLMARDVDDNGELLENSVLHFAVDSRAPDALAIVEHLLAARADPLERNRHDDTVLHYAAKNNDQSAIFAALLARVEQAGAATFSAAIAAVNQEGLALIHVIVSQRRVAFLEVLLAAIDRMVTPVASPPSSPSMLSTSSSLSLTELREYIDRFELFPHGFRPAIWSEKSALLNQPEKRTGRTALLRAVMQQRDADSPRMVLLLLAHHADPRCADWASVDCAAACVSGGGGGSGVGGNCGDGDASDDDERQRQQQLREKQQLQLSVYLQKSINLLQQLEGSKARMVRVPVRAANIGGQHAAVLHMTAAEQAVLIADTRRPKRQYKKRKLANGGELE